MFKITNILIVVIFMFSSIGLSKPKDYRSLEELAWFAEDENISLITNMIAKQLKNNRRSSFLYYLLTVCYVKKFENNPTQIMFLQKANQLANEAMSIDPHASHSILSMVFIESYMGQNETAINLIKDSRAFTKKPYPWRIELAAASVSSRDSLERAIKHLNAAMIDKTYNKRVIHTHLVRTLKKKYLDKKDLLVVLKKFQEKYPSQYIEQEIAFVLSKQNDTQSAEKILSRQFRSRQITTRGKLHSAMINYAFLNNTRQANRVIKTIDKKTIQNKYHSTYEVHKALIDFSLNKKTMAKKRLYKIFSEDLPESEYIYIEKFFAKKNQLIFLRNALETTVQNKGTSELYMRIARIQRKLQQTQKALNNFQNVSIIDDTRSDAYVASADILLELKRYPLAETALNLAINRDPENSKIHYLLATVQAKSNKNQSSLRSLEAAFSIDPDLKIMALKDKNFSNLKNKQAFKNLINRQHFIYAH